MRPNDQVVVVSFQEGTHYVRSERKAHTAVVLAPPDNVSVRVRPEEVAKEPRVWHVSWPNYSLNLLD